MSEPSDAGFAADLADAVEDAPSYVNYLDIKLHEITQLPREWYESATDAPAYPSHPFRYEVTVHLPTDPVPDSHRNGGSTRKAAAVSHDRKSITALSNTDAAASPTTTSHTFTHGRLLQPLPHYQRYIDLATAPAMAGLDEVDAMRDIPEPLELPAETTETASQTSLGAHDPTVTLGTDSPLVATLLHPPVLLWVATELTDAVPSPPAPIETNMSNTMNATARKRKKNGTAHGSDRAVTGPVTTDATALPALPPKSAPAPCVLRLPLDARQEAGLESLLTQHRPLLLSFRRVVRPGAPPEWDDLNASYYEAVIPVALDALAEPGSLGLDAIVPLEPSDGMTPDYTHDDDRHSPTASVTPRATSEGMDHDRARRRAAARRAKSGLPATLYEEPDGFAVHPYVVHHTVARVSLRLRSTLTRLASDRVRPGVSPRQLLAGRARTRQPCAPPDAVAELQRVVRQVALCVLREARDAGVQDAGATEWRDRFLDLLQSSGRLLGYQDMLTPAIRHVVRDRFPRPTSATLPDLTSELYVYLLECVHTVLPTVLRVRVDDDDSMTGANTPAEVQMERRWLQRAREAEASGDLELAIRYHQARLTTNTDVAASPRMWCDAAEFYTRVRDGVRAEQCYREAIACDALYVRALVGYGVWLLSYDRLTEAAVFLHGAVDVAAASPLAWGCIALLDDLFLLALPDGDPTTAAQQAKWTKERRYAIQTALQCVVTPTEHADDDDDPLAVVVGVRSEHELCLLLAELLLGWHHAELAHVCLTHCENGGAALERLYARLFMQTGQFAEALRVLDAIPDNDGDDNDSMMQMMRRDEVRLRRADCLAACGDVTRAVTLYKEVLCKGLGTLPPYLDDLCHAHTEEMQTLPCTTRTALHRGFVEAYVRLGNLLLGLGKYTDALGVFTLGIQAWPCGLTWLGAGIAYYRHGDLAAAEECLNESNTHNPLNPRTWAFLALLCVHTAQPALDEVVQQVRRHGLRDGALWAELGRALLHPGHRPELSEGCLRQALMLLLPELSAAETARRTCAEDDTGTHPRRVSAGAARVRGKPKRATTAPRPDDAARRRGASGLESVALQKLVAGTRYHLAQALRAQQRWQEARQLLLEVARSTEDALRARAEQDLEDMQDEM